MTFKASVLSHSGHRRLLSLLDDGKEKAVGKDDPYWTEIKALDAAGNAVKGLPKDGGCFEIVPEAKGQ